MGFTLFSRRWFSPTFDKVSTNNLRCVNHSKSSQPVLQLSPAQPLIQSLRCIQAYDSIPQLQLPFQIIVAKQARRPSRKIKGWHIRPAFSFLQEERRTFQSNGGFTTGKLCAAFAGTHIKPMQSQISMSHHKTSGSCSSPASTSFFTARAKGHRLLF